MNTALLSGFELLQAASAGTFPLASMAETMGITRMIVEKGRVIIHAKADNRHFNALGGVHGGFAATLLDTVTGCAVHSLLDPGVRYATVDLGVKMLRPVPVDEELVAEATVTHVSRSIGASEGRLFDAAGNLLASASATCFIKQAKP